MLVAPPRLHPVIAVLDGDGMPLYLQRSRRTASEAQRLALLARDTGCTRPGCEQPANMCAAHHITDWAKGGPTDIDNLAFACDHCHALINDGPDGWKIVVMGEDSPFPGRTGWIAPKSLDPTGTPRVNERHHVGQVIAAAVDSSCRTWRSRVSSKPRCSSPAGVRRTTGSVVASSALPDLG
ncbi:HNH endonuclease signature motif containing protein [Nocardia sp. NPDC004582]